MKVCMLSTTHDVLDDRIYWKEAISLKNHGYEVTCITSSDKDEEGITEEGIKYIKVKKRRGRNKLQRLILFYKRHLDLFHKAEEVNADIYEFHDLYLNLIGRKLKNLHHNTKVIYDVHEAFPDMIRDYKATRGLSTVFKHIYARFIDMWEIRCSRYYDLIITADNCIADRFRKKIKNRAIEEIYNFTDLSDDAQPLPFEDRIYDMVYCGSITRVRGILNLLEAVKIGRKEKADIKLLLLGPFCETGLKEKAEAYIKENDMEKNVAVLGVVPHKMVGNYLRQCRIGIVPLLSIPKFFKNIPIKQFEYMMFGLPVVGSNLPPIRKYIEGSCCGEIVDSGNPEEIWDAVSKILNNRKLYEYYSRNGYKAAVEKYNWSVMDKKLISLYKSLE